MLLLIASIYFVCFVTVNDNCYRVTFYRNVFRKKVSECVCARSASMVNGRLRIYLLSSVFVFVDDFTDYICVKHFS